MTVLDGNMMLPYSNFVSRRHLLCITTKPKIYQLDVPAHMPRFSQNYGFPKYTARIVASEYTRFACRQHLLHSAHFL